MATRDPETAFLQEASRTSELETGCVGPQGIKVPFWVEIGKLVDEAEVGTGNNCTGRHLAVQLAVTWQH